MEKTVCVRCGQEINPKHYMIQVVVYLGQYGERQPICDKCHESFMNWMKNLEE